jgi:hypothetical protein
VQSLPQAARTTPSAHRLSGGGAAGLVIDTQTLPAPAPMSQAAMTLRLLCSRAARLCQNSSSWLVELRTRGECPPAECRDGPLAALVSIPDAPLW